MTTLWASLQVIVNILILAAILFYIYERKNINKEIQNDELKKKELKELISSLGQLIAESERSSKKIFDNTIQSQSKSQDLLDQLETKQAELQNEVKKAESVLKKINNPLEINQNKENHIITRKDKYIEVANLAKSGLNTEEISRRLDLPKGEVELILDLPLRNLNKTNQRT